MTHIVHPTDILVVVDMQNDFLPGGSLAVAGGDEIIPLINRLAQKFTNIIITQDWHPPDHISFASNHPGKRPFDVVNLDYGPQVLWPDHCIQGEMGAELASGLDLPQAQLILRKGYNRAIDSYSAFQEADRQTLTGLAGYLKERAAGRLYVVGLATDFCVGWTAMDAASAGFDVTVIEDATRAINNDESLARTWSDMQAAGIAHIISQEFLG